jgi:hypothetical protein
MPWSRGAAGSKRIRTASLVWSPWAANVTVT